MYPKFISKPHKPLEPDFTKKILISTNELYNDFIDIKTIPEGTTHLYMRKEMGYYGDCSCILEYYKEVELTKTEKEKITKKYQQEMKKYEKDLEKYNEYQKELTKIRNNKEYKKYLKLKEKYD